MEVFPRVKYERDPLMKQRTKSRKQAASDIHILLGQERLAKELLTITNFGKAAFDSLNHELGRMLVESIFLLERESITGPDHAPFTPGVYKWGHQGGSVYVGDQKLRVAGERERDHHALAHAAG